MARKSKRFRQIEKEIDLGRAYPCMEAIETLKGCPPVKFNQSVDVAVKMGLDPRKSDQAIRGTVSLPHGTGKQLIVAALVKGEKVQEALDAGADFAGIDLIEKIKGGWTAFDALVTTPDMMREVGKLGKILGPRGLMPTPKAGTVAVDVGKVVKEIKGGKVEFRLDRHGVVTNAVGRLSFTAEQLKDNLLVLLDALQRAKPATAKGQYMRSAVLSSTMGPGLKIDLREMD